MTGEPRGAASEAPELGGGACAAEEVEGLLAELSGRLQSILRGYRIPPWDAEDVLQEVLLQLLLKRSEVRCPVGWLLVTLRNRCIIYWRHRRRRLGREVGVDPEDLVLRAGGSAPEQRRVELRMDLTAALAAALPPRRRELLVRYNVLGEGIEQLGPGLGYSPASVRKTTSRARRAVAEHLRAQGW